MSMIGEGLMQLDKVYDRYRQGREDAIKEFKQAAEADKITMQMLNDAFLSKAKRDSEALKLIRESGLVRGGSPESPQFDAESFKDVIPAETKKALGIAKADEVVDPARGIAGGDIEVVNIDDLGGGGDEIDMSAAQEVGDDINNIDPNYSPITVEDMVLAEQELDPNSIEAIQQQTGFVPGQLNYADTSVPYLAKRFAKWGDEEVGPLIKEGVDLGTNVARDARDAASNTIKLGARGVEWLADKAGKAFTSEPVGPSGAAQDYVSLMERGPSLKDLMSQYPDAMTDAEIGLEKSRLMGEQKAFSTFLNRYTDLVKAGAEQDRKNSEAARKAAEEAKKEEGKLTDLQKKEVDDANNYVTKLQGKGFIQPGDVEKALDFWRGLKTPMARATFKTQLDKQVWTVVRDRRNKFKADPNLKNLLPQLSKFKTEEALDAAIANIDKKKPGLLSKGQKQDLKLLWKAEGL